MNWLMNRHTKPTRKDIKVARIPIKREEDTSLTPEISELENEEPTRILLPEEIKDIMKKDEEIGKMLRESEDLCEKASSRSMKVAKACGR